MTKNERDQDRMNHSSQLLHLSAIIIVMIKCDSRMDHTEYCSVISGIFPWYLVMLCFWASVFIIRNSWIPVKKVRWIDDMLLQELRKRGSVTDEQKENKEEEHVSFA